LRSLLLGLALAALATFLSWYWVVADRDFERYAGIEVGMTQKLANLTLESKGWRSLGIYRGAEPGVVGRCGPGEALVFVEGTSPDYTLIIHTDDECIVTRITRRARTLEL